MKNGVYRSAIKRFELALKLNSRLVRTHYYLGVCLHKLERYSAACTELEKALEFFPEDSKIHYQIALTYDALRQPQIARDHYRQVSTLKSNLLSNAGRG